MKQLRKSEIKDINKEIFEYYKEDSIFNPKEKVIIKDDMIFRNHAEFFKHNDVWVPTIRTLLQHNLLKEVVVDMGAVKFVVNGADIMRPGVVSCNPQIAQGDIIVIKDVNNSKPLAIGTALFSGEELMSQSGGKVVASLHYVGDNAFGLLFLLNTHKPYG